MFIKYWTGQEGLYEFDYDGGEHSPVVGETINVDGEEGAETAVAVAWTVASGSWAGNDAAGKMWVCSASAAFIANLENNDVIEDSGATKICDTAGVAAEKTGDRSAAGNWGPGEDPAVPVAGDVWIFDARSSVDITEGIGIANRASTGGAANAPSLIHVKSGNGSNIGTSDDYLYIGDAGGGSNPVKIIFEGTGNMYLACSEDDATTDSEISLVLLNSEYQSGGSSGKLWLKSDVNSASYTAEFVEIIQVKGDLNIADDTNYAKLRIVPSASQNANVTIGTGCTDAKDSDAAPDILQVDGTLTTDSPVNEWIKVGGTATFGTDLGASPATGLNIETLWNTSGTFTWQPDDSDDDAYIARAYLLGGNLTSNSAVNNDRTKYIGNGEGYDWYVFSGATLSINNGRGNIEIAANSQLFNMGGKIIADSGAAVTIGYNNP